jgi:hypothetical protein
MKASSSFFKRIAQKFIKRELPLTGAQSLLDLFTDELPFPLDIICFDLRHHPYELFLKPSTPWKLLRGTRVKESSKIRRIRAGAQGFPEPIRCCPFFGV